MTAKAATSSRKREDDRAERLRLGRAHLRRVDPTLARLMDRFPDYDPRGWMRELPPMDLHGALLFQVVGQQLSLYVTRAIIGRIHALFGGRFPSPEEMVRLSPEDLRATGLSRRKVATLKDLAERFADGRLNAETLSNAPDEEVLSELTKVPGIGAWTAQGALITALQRQDVVMPGDLALRKAVQKVYGLDHIPSPDEVLTIAQKWRPYRSLATSYLFAAAYGGSD
jgi:DNA-3-methyladenine glycosylase II